MENEFLNWERMTAEEKVDWARERDTMPGMDYRDEKWYDRSYEEKLKYLKEVRKDLSSTGKLTSMIDFWESLSPEEKLAFQKAFDTPSLKVEKMIKNCAEALEIHRLKAQKGAQDILLKVKNQEEKKRTFRDTRHRIGWITAIITVIAFMTPVVFPGPFTSSANSDFLMKWIWCCIGMWVLTMILNPIAGFLLSTLFYVGHSKSIDRENERMNSLKKER